MSSSDTLDLYSGNIIDVHNHLFTPRIIKTMIKGMDPKRFDNFDKKFNISNNPVFNGSIELEGIVKQWIEAMDQHNVSKLVWFPFKGFHEEIYKVVAKFPERFIGFIWFDMLNPSDSLEILKDGVKNHGIKGIKINPSADHVHPHDKKMYTAYEYMEKHSLTVLSHYGISMAPDTDVKYINPFDIQVAARDFPGINFIVAHMGAGFVRESLFLMYHDLNDNLFFDCSGSGSWINYLPQKTSFEDIYRRYIEVGGVEKLVFGTDSNLKGYRVEVLQQNLEIFKNLGLSREEMEKIMYKNAEKIFNV